MYPVTRRDFVRATSVLAASTLAGGLPSGSAAAEGPIPKTATPKPSTTFPHAFLTPAADFEDVSRGNPKPFTLKGDALVAARLTPETWRLEVTADATVDDVVKQPASITKALTLVDGTALDLT